MTRADDASATTRRLLSACGAPGCPVCRCVEEESRRDLAAVLAEHVTDVDTRRRLRASGGFCGWHARLLSEVPDSAFGTAILCHDLLGRMIAGMRELADEAPSTTLAGWLRPPGRRAARGVLARQHRQPACPACERAADAEARYLRSALAAAGTREARAAWPGSDGLCAPHLLRAVELAPRHPALPALVTATLARWAEVRSDLAAFLAKHQERGPRQFTEGERAARGRALGVLAGTPGLFGSELSRGRRPR